MQWQPIETAPKTSMNYIAVPILGFCPEEYFNPESGSDDRIRIVWWEPKRERWNDDRDLREDTPKPTHWMPLPLPPTK